MEFLVDSFFFFLPPFKDCKYIIPLPQVSMVSDEKLVVNLIKGPLYKMSYFSHNFQDFLLSSSLDSLIIMCLRVDHFEFILLGSFWMHRFLSFTKFGKIFGIISLNILSVPFSHFPLLGLCLC